MGKKGGLKFRITAWLLVSVMLMTFSACNGRILNGKAQKSKTDEGVKIAKTAADSLETEKYENADFSITVPKGWKVTTGGAKLACKCTACGADVAADSAFCPQCGTKL